MATPKNPAEIIAQLQELKAWKENAFPRLAARRAEAFFKNNFRVQGYTNKGLRPWDKRKPDLRAGRAILVQTGILRDSIRATASGGVVKVESGKIYALIHNEGGTITQTVTKQQRAYFWAKHYEAKSRKNTADMQRFKSMALSKIIAINMPQRQFMPKPSESMPFELSEILRRDVEKKLETLMAQ